MPGHEAIRSAYCVIRRREWAPVTAAAAEIAVLARTAIMLERRLRRRPGAGTPAHQRWREGRMARGGPSLQVERWRRGDRARVTRVFRPRHGVERVGT